MCVCVCICVYVYMYIDTVWKKTVFMQCPYKKDHGVTLEFNIEKVFLLSKSKENSLNFQGNKNTAYHND